MSNPLIQSRDAFAAEHPEKRITLNGREWGYIDVGQGPVLLLIPGTLGRCDVFWQQIEALKGRLRIVAATYPATGGIADWAGDLVSLMDHLNIDKAAVLGSSLGGYVAQYFAGATPERMTKLLAANTLDTVVGISTRMPYALDLMNAPIEDIRAGFGNGLGQWREAHPEQSDVVDLLMMEVGGRIPEAELRARLNATKTGPELPPPAIPASDIVTIEADDDPLIPPDMRAGVRARLSPSVAYRYLSGGHFPYIARPDTYTALLEQVMGLDVTGPNWGQEQERSL
ncbi:MAG: alpha/beta hydrolase [Rhodobacteraceae bacterium]|nr:alpha/beta hydrolase [Paracoccaceae bacterium]